MIPISFVPLDPARSHALISWINSPGCIELVKQLECLELEQEILTVQFQRESLEKASAASDAVESAKKADFYQKCRELIVEIASGSFALKQPNPYP